MSYSLPRLLPSRSQASVSVTGLFRREHRGPAGLELNRRRLLRAAFGATVSAEIGRRLGPAAPRLRAQEGDDGTIVVQWDRAALQAVRATTLGPPMVARALAILHTCIYDAWTMYDPVAVTTTGANVPRQPASARTDENKRRALSFAAYRALADLFPTELATFDGLLRALRYDPADASSNPSTPAGVGTLCADAVLAYRHPDGSNQLGDLYPGPYSDYTGYQLVNTPDTIVDPNHWQPLIVPNAQGVFAVQQYIGPHWGAVAPFAMTSGDQFRPTEGPATYGSEQYQTQAMQILEYSLNLTDEQKVITEYWADAPGTVQPPGHWCLFGQYISQRDGHDLDTDVQLFFILSNALLDAGIAAWDAKRVWDYVRPITAVHYLYRGQQIRAWGGPFSSGTQTMLGENWLVYQAPTVITPAFPEFFSGHSTFSAAAAEVLQRFTDSDRFGASTTVPAKSSLLEPGFAPAQDVTLVWETFSDAANQAGMSRRYGGIHFVQGDLVGRAVGRLVGAQAWDRAQAYITGSG